MQSTASDDHAAAIEDRDTVPHLVALIDSLRSLPAIDPAFSERLLAVRELAQPEPEPAESTVFLTVLLRTQGRRIEPLKDALLCLQGQTDSDFEVNLLVHDPIAEDLAEVESIVDRLPPTFRDRVALTVVAGGSRAVPLNIGVAAARGAYIAVFDDDDLLFANWVEVFHREASTHRGRLIRSVVANQSVELEMWPGDEDGFRTTTWPKAEYPATFDQLQHLLVNYSPFMSWAFPRDLFHLYGLRFDETLAVTEDWDVILRGSLICGVDDVPELTAIYRRWSSGSSSYTTHERHEWLDSEARVIDRVDSSVMMMPPGTMGAARRMVDYNNTLDAYRFLFAGGRLRFPLNRMWEAAAPGVKVALRVRNKARRLRARSRDRS